MCHLWKIRLVIGSPCSCVVSRQATRSTRQRHLESKPCQGLFLSHQGSRNELQYKIGISAAWLHGCIFQHNQLLSFLNTWSGEHVLSSSSQIKKKVYLFLGTPGAGEFPIKTILVMRFSSFPQGSASASSLTSMTAWKTCLKGWFLTARMPFILKMVPGNARHEHAMFGQTAVDFLHGIRSANLRKLEDVTQMPWLMGLCLWSGSGAGFCSNVHCLNGLVSATLGTSKHHRQSTQSIRAFLWWQLP